MLTVSGNRIAVMSPPPTFHLANTTPPKLTQEEMEERKRLMAAIR